MWHIEKFHDANFRNERVIYLIKWPRKKYKTFHWFSSDLILIIFFSVVWAELNLLFSFLSQDSIRKSGKYLLEQNDRIFKIRLNLYSSVAEYLLFFFRLEKNTTLEHSGLNAAYNFLKHMFQLASRYSACIQRGSQWRRVQNQFP